MVVCIAIASHSAEPTHVLKSSPTERVINYAIINENSTENGIINENETNNTDNPNYYLVVGGHNYTRAANWSVFIQSAINWHYFVIAVYSKVSI